VVEPAEAEASNTVWNHSRNLLVLFLSLWVMLACHPALAVAGPPTPKNPFDETVAPLNVGDSLPAISLTDQHGRPLRFTDLRGQAVIVGFIYTSCHDVCPLITHKFAQLDQLLGDGPYQLVEVTIDPDHDTGSVLAAYARRYGVSGPRWRLVTGAPDEVRTFLRSAGVSVVDNGHGELVHSARLLIVAPDGRLADVVELVAWDPKTVAARTASLVGRGSNVLTRVDFALTKQIAQLCGGSYQLATGIVDVIAAVMIVAAGVLVLVWMRRRLFAQGA
jgi:cytochrome oxidase Cu insertion factor (SCO1/SenC/PrrC family)